MDCCKYLTRMHTLFLYVYILLLLPGLIADLFPGLDCPRVRYPDFNDAVESVLVNNKYILDEHQVDKVIQLYETMLTRHTTMVVGNTGGGKSVVINALAQAQKKLEVPTKLYVLNAKVCERNFQQLSSSFQFFNSIVPCTTLS